MASEIGTYGEELYEQVLPLHGPDPDGLARDYIGAVTHGAIEVDDLVRDNERGPGWGDILDPAWAPVKGLLWLAQIAGVELRAPRVLSLAANYMPRPSFEASDDPAGWVATIGTGTMTRQASPLTTHGSYVGRFQPLGDASSEVTYNTAIPVPGGKTYTLGFDITDVKITAGNEFAFFMDWLDGATIIDSAQFNIGTRGRYGITAVVPAEADGVKFRVTAPFDVSGGDEFVDVDAIRLVDGTDAPYIDGSVPGYGWAGAPFASVTVQNRLETPEEWAVYARAAIVEQSAKRRGSPGAILAAARDTLTGTKSARLVERVGGNAYRMTLVTRPSETPDPALTVAAARTQVAVSRKLTHTLTEGAAIDEGTKSIDSVAVPIDSATLPDIAD